MWLKQIGLWIIFYIISISASITITENTRERISFNFDIGNYTISNNRSRVDMRSTINFPGSNNKIYENGVFIPSLTLYTGLPPEGNAKVTFLSQKVKRITLDHPLQKRLPDQKVGKNTRHTFKNPWISDIEYVFFRNLRTGRLYIKPFIYDEKNQTLTVLIKGSCTIEFPGSDRYSSVSQVKIDDYYKMLKAILINFNIARGWIHKSSYKYRSPKRSHGRGSGSGSGSTLTFQVGDGTNAFNEATTYENGVLKINAADVYSFLSSRNAINHISLYGSIKNKLDHTVPPDSSIPEGRVEIPLLPFDLDRDGLFNNNDYILAYVSGISDWIFDTSIHDYSFYLHHYDNFRHYWLTSDYNNKTISRYSCNEISLPQNKITTVNQYIRYKKSKYLRLIKGGDNHGKEPYGGVEWIWKQFEKRDTLTFTAMPSDPLMSITGYLKIKGIGNDSLFSVYRGNVQLKNPQNWTAFTNWNDSNIVMNYNTTSKDDFYQLQHVDLKYTQSLDMANKKKLRIYSPLDSGKIVTYTLTSLPNERFVIFRLPVDESDMQLITDTILSGGTYSWVDTSGLGIQYFFCTESHFLQPPSFKPVSLTTRSGNVIETPRTASNNADYLVITHNNFKYEAERLVTHKINTGRFPHAKLIDIETIYRYFSGGNQDPGAIRNFLLYAVTFWNTKPSYVLLFGNGNYDYRNIRTREINYIATLQTKNEGQNNECLEDFFSILKPGQYMEDLNSFPDLFLGRIPCNTKIEAKTVVDKIIDTEDPLKADFGPWRNRLLLISDDDIQGKGYDYINHFQGNEDIEDSVKSTRPSIEIRKVILFEYEFNSVYEKPEAALALINEMNRGVSCVNYFGHGGYNALADEYILEKDKVRNFQNYKRYPIFNSFSCSVGKFDDPGKTCLSGELLKLPDAGAIAAISSARVAYATANENMAKVFYSFLYGKNDTVSLGQAYLFTKAVQSGNLKNYVFLGDPSIQYLNVQDTIQMTITDIDGTPLKKDSLTSLPTIQAYQTIMVTGKVKAINSPTSNFNTTNDSVQIALYNPDLDSTIRKDGITFSNPVYSMPGPLVFIGDTKFDGGTFEQKILIPRTLDFNKPGVRLTAYAWNESGIATGNVTDLLFKGSQPPKFNDTEGPRIGVRPVYDVDSLWNTSATFTDKISSFLPLDIEINLWDESGIDVRGIGPDEGLTIQIDKVVKKENINHKFKFNEGEFTKGQAIYHFKSEQMKPGPYLMAISAQDLLGNISALELTLEILGDDDFRLGHVFNYPNPVKMGSSTKFYFYHSNTSTLLSQHGGVDATIKIFTLSGRLIRVFPRAVNGQEWDLKDQSGNRLTPNVYLYRVYVKRQNGNISGRTNEIKSRVKKLVIHPPR